MGQNKNKVAPKITKRRTFGKRLWKGMGCNTGIRDRGLRQHLQGRYKVEDLGGGQPRYLKKPTGRKYKWREGQILT
jgi:hypothetical protein